MKSSEILDGVFDHLYDNETIKQFCFDEFGKIGTVQKGLDNDEFPPQSLMPVVVVGPVQRLGRGDSSFITRFLLFISVTIKNKNVTKEPMDTQGDAVSSTQGKVEIEGATQVEEFRELIEQELFGYRKNNMIINISGETLTESDFPIFRSMTSVEIQVKELSNRNLSGK